MSAAHPQAIRAQSTLDPGGRWVDGGGVVVHAGKITAFCASSGALRRTGAPVLDLGDVVLLPGFVAAHAHLDLSGFHGRVAPSASFPDWIRALLRVRATLDEADLRLATRAAAELLVAGGTTSVGDVDSSGRLAAVADGLALRVRRHREALDAGDPARADGALATLAGTPQRAPRSLWSEGLSPHAPYTVSAQLWRELARLARRRRIPVAIHWAETLEERAWLERGEGPFAGLLAHAPRRSGLDAIESAGLLGARTALIHGNDATEAERERIARSGATLVHCPGTHAFFGRPAFDARAWRAAGVPIALGTDSLASNDALDMRREMALFRAAQPDFAPAEVLELATVAGARAIGFAGRAGTLAPGAWADLAAHESPGATAPERLDAITRGLGRVRGTWVGGRRAFAADGADSPTSRIGKGPSGTHNAPDRRRR